MHVSFMYRRFDYCKVFAGTFSDLDSKPLRPRSSMFIHSARAFHVGLVSYLICRKSNNDPVWVAKKALKKEVKSSKNKLFLLETEEHFCNGNFDQARV